jgi:glycosyltransferase involved in cell wall biosynthesis
LTPREGHKDETGPAAGDRLESSASRRLSVLGIYPWGRFWSMGEFRGAPSFFLAPQALVKAGHDVHISMPGHKGAAAEDYHGMKLHRYRFGIDFMPMVEGALARHLTRPFRFAYYVLLATLNGLLTARRVRPDVVVGYGAFGTPVAFLVARSMALPNVTRLFGQSLSLGFEKGWRAKVKLVLNYVEIVAFLTPCSRLIVCNDGSSGRAVAARLGVPAERLRYWRNGVDKGLFRPPPARGGVKSELGFDPDEPVLLAAGRLDKEKHHERLLHGLPGVLREFPRAVAVIVGDGDQRGFLKAEAQRLGVEGSVRFTGAIEREALALYYKACDVFVTLSDRTNVANPTEEAMMCGCCVVALDAGETSEVIGDGGAGVVVSRGDLGRLAEIVVDLLRNHERRIELGRRAAALAGELLPSVEERQDMEAGAVGEVVG